MKKERRPFLYYLAGFVVPVYYRLVFGMKIAGKENIPSHGPVILASNHVTARDPVFLGCACKRQIHYMAKASLFQNKLLAFIIRYAGAFPVERGTGGAEALQEAYELLENQRVIGVFIEGTRSKTGELLNPKTGVSLLAYRTHAPVVPVSIIGKGGKCPKAFGKMRIVIGKPLAFEELGMTEESGLQFRKAAKLIMGKIRELRERAIQEMG